MANFILMILAGAFNGVGDFFSKLTAEKISPYLAAMLLSLFSAITIAVYLFLIKGPSGNMSMTRQGFLFAVLGGVAIGISSIFFFVMFSKGVNLSLAQPIVKSTLVIVAVLLGVIALREKMTVNQIIGLALSLVGIYFLTK
ncbi:MAG: EamA family transporter [Patescibacteria group bacterium]|nr:EamA family transporter [Patescibacteria group bacterium]